MQVVNSKYYHKRVPIKALAMFRILFGFLLCFQFYKLSKRIVFYADPEYLFFPYPELDWIPVFPYGLLWCVFMLGLLGSFAVLVGWRLRNAGFIAALSFFYLFALDSVYFNNHYYLIALLCLLLSITDADKMYSITKTKLEHVPNWHYVILQLQIALVFFYGGLAKLSDDWLSGRVLEGISESAIVTNFLVYSGTFFDLLIPFFLFHYWSRKWAIILLIIFNVANHYIFDDIAAFPVLMIAALILFFNEGEFPKSIIEFFKIRFFENMNQIEIEHSKFALILIFFAFQFIFPLRHHLIEGHPEWTGQGHYFAWRMKSYKKNVQVRFYAFDKKTNTRLYPINHGLNNLQIQRSCAMPHMIPIFAKQIKDKIDKLDGVDPNIGISVDYKVSLNGYKPQLNIDPDVDLAEVDFNCYGSNEWINTFKRLSN